VTDLFQFLFHLITYKNKSFLWKLRGILRFFPGRIDLYEKAFIHKSTNLSGDNGNPVNNERLEYLGDAVLGSVIAEHLFKEYPDKNEGFLTKMRSKIVNGENLGALAEKMGIVPLIRTQAIGDHTLKHISGDAFEALIGAIYMDKGYHRTHKFILKNILNRHIDLIKLERTESNYKSQLIEWGQKHKKEVCFYTDVEPYDPTRFISYVSIGDNLYGSGSGISKKEAEQMAAGETIKELSKS
jgi:ribonuclease-3